MLEQNKDFFKRIKELSERSYQNSQFTFTSFLSPGELSDFYEQLSFPSSNAYSISPCSYTVFGGYENAERCMVRFGSKDELMYELPFPIQCLKIAPLNPKFSDVLTHRDYLGCLMNLGIERHLLGDILPKDNECYIFIEDTMSEFVKKELCRIKHTTVMCTTAEVPDTLLSPSFEEINILAKSARIDSIVAKLSKLSRQKTSEMFPAKKIYVNGKITENESYQLKANDIVSIRGYGKYIFNGSCGSTRKGNLCFSISRYI